MATADASQPPLRLGPPESPPPDFSLLPSAMAEVTGAMMSMLTLETTHDAVTVWSGVGTGIGSQAFTGRACVAADPQRHSPGLHRATSSSPRMTPAYEAILPIVGAVVTDHGGLTSHAALVAGELGLPAVLGVINATTTIPDGATVTVDPSWAGSRSGDPGPRSGQRNENSAVCVRSVVEGDDEHLAGASEPLRRLPHYGVRVGVRVVGEPATVHLDRRWYHRSAPATCSTPAGRTVRHRGGVRYRPDRAEASVINIPRRC